MTDKRKGIWYERHSDDEWIDEVRIVTVPRFKTSGMSGDEWRVSAKVQLLRKGVVLKERSFSKLHYAVDFLPAIWHEYGDEGCPDADSFNEYCFQPGCQELAVTWYRVKDEYVRPYGIKRPKYDWRQDVRRGFCEAHSVRGDSDLEDRDSNYELISGPGRSVAAFDAADAAESPSAQVVVNLDSLDSIPDAINPLRD